MTPDQFQRRLHKLVGLAVKSKICGACLVRYLMQVSVAIAAVDQLDADTLAAHGLPVDTAGAPPSDQTVRH